MPEKRWDSTNKPIGFILGVTPGFAQFEQGDNRLAYMGFARKITKAARLGFEFAEIDFEQLSEALEPDIGLQVRRIKEAQGIEIGLHLPVEVDLTLADAFSWRYMHDMVKIGARAGQDIGSKFILFHTSSHMRPNITSLFGRPEPRQRLVAPDGTNFGDWIVKNNLKDWFMAKFIKVMLNAVGSPGDPTVVEFFEKVESYESSVKMVKTQIENAKRTVEEKLNRLISIVHRFRENKNPTPEEHRAAVEAEMELNKINSNFRGYVKLELEKIVGEEKSSEYFQVNDYVDHYKFEKIFDYWSKQGSEAEEYVAYLTVAKKLHRDRDKLWEIVKSKDDPYELARKANMTMGSEAILPEVIKQIVAAVAGAYIRGHLMASGQQYGVMAGSENKKSFVSIYDFCKANKIHIFIETAMPERGGEGGELRLIRVTDHVNIIKAIDGGDNISYCMDFEHLITNLIDPIKESLIMQKGDGKYIRMLHINAPRPITGAHAPLEPMSLDMLVIYKWLYNLRMAGMADAYMLWEMGSYGVRQSAIAFRNIIAELSKNPPTNPKDLKPEFFGIDEEMKARQMLAIRQHAYDPIKGLMVVPEEEWSMLGEIARRRGKLQEWDKRKYR
jgi:sugar phosphate isomerase/epimerase